MDMRERKQRKTNSKPKPRSRSLTEIRRTEYEFLKQNWTTEVPNGIISVVLDGTNIRGGGPRRRSRDDVIGYAEDIDHTNVNVPVICYFDGRPAKCKKTEVELRFSKSRIADDVIVEFIKTQHPSKVLLVTSDRGLAIRALNLGSYVMRNNTFKDITALKICK